MREWFTGIVVVLLAALLVLLGWWARGVVDAYHAAVNTPIVEAAEPVPPPPCGDYWVVTPGDTLWSIARRCYPGEHTGRMVHEITSANPGVDAGRLQVGQRLVLPERGR